MAAIVGAGTLLVATPALAVSKSPSALNLANKLVTAGVCTAAARVTNTTTAKCEHAPNFDIEVHAYPNQRARRAAISTQVGEDCALIFGPTIEYWVGPTWWVFHYEGVPRIGKVLGGTLRTYNCP
jgi:hypothetical protein